MARIASNRSSFRQIALTAFTVALTLVACTENQDPADGACSIISLISNPNLYDGKRIRTEGFAVVQFEGSGVYLSRESADNGAHLNGIGLALRSVEDAQRLAALVDGKWVIAEGTYHRWELGETGFRGYINDVTVLYPPGDVNVRE